MFSSRIIISVDYDGLNIDHQILESFPSNIFTVLKHSFQISNCFSLWLSPCLSPALPLSVPSLTFLLSLSLSLCQHIFPVTFNNK